MDYLARVALKGLLGLTEQQAHLDSQVDRVQLVKVDLLERPEVKVYPELLELMVNPERQDQMVNKESPDLTVGSSYDPAVQCVHCC